MRVLFCCRPAYGHLYPLLPLALACREAGHDVVFGTGEGFVERVARLGFAVEQVGISIPEADERVLREQPELNDLPRGERFRIGVAVFGELLPRHTIEDLLPLLRRAAAPRLVVYDETDVGAPIAAAIAGIPAIAHSLGPQAPDMVRRAVSEPLPRVWRTFDPGATPRDVFTANAYFDICPPSLQAPGTEPGRRIPLRPDPPPDTGDRLPDWVTTERSRPLIYVTLGTYVHGQVDSLRATVEAMGDLDVDALVAVGPQGDPASLGSPPSAVRVERFVPQAALMPHVDVVAHHCGSGTMLGALRHGLPQLALPHGADQFSNARALIDSGAGRRLLPEEITPEAVSEALSALLTEPGYRRQASRLGAEIAAMPPPAEVVSELERLYAS